MKIQLEIDLSDEQAAAIVSRVCPEDIDRGVQPALRGYLERELGERVQQEIDEASANEVTRDLENGDAELVGIDVKPRRAKASKKKKRK